jgi:hypothetical protein
VLPESYLALSKAKLRHPHDECYFSVFASVIIRLLVVCQFGLMMIIIIINPN